MAPYFLKQTLFQQEEERGTTEPTGLDTETRSPGEANAGIALQALHHRPGKHVKQKRRCNRLLWKRTMQQSKMSRKCQVVYSSKVRAETPRLQEAMDSTANTNSHTHTQSMPPHTMLHTCMPDGLCSQQTSRQLTGGNSLHFGRVLKMAMLRTPEILQGEQGTVISCVGTELLLDAGTSFHYSRFRESTRSSCARAAGCHPSVVVVEGALYLKRRRFLCHQTVLQIEAKWAPGKRILPISRGRGGGVLADRAVALEGCWLKRRNPFVPCRET